MQIQSFKIFCDLVETESFTKAAQISGVTQSAVSQQVSSLERQLKSLLNTRRRDRYFSSLIRRLRNWIFIGGPGCI